MPKTQKKTPILFLGNGPHTLAKGPTWEHVIRDLCESYAPSVPFDTADPFPLIFEQLLLASPENSRREYQIKSEIAAKVDALETTETLRNILSYPWSEILTTNYDFLIEQTLDPGFKPRNAGNKKESKYSLFRHHDTKNTRVWHIHGDVKAPNSILLGYDHYMGAVQKVRTHIVQKYFRKRVTYRPSSPNFAWAEHFLAEEHPNIVMLGFGFNPFEYDLWWLLVYRARRMARNLVKNSGTIQYFYPSSLESQIRRSTNLLAATGVKLTKVQSPDHGQNYYERALRAIEREHFA